MPQHLAGKEIVKAIVLFAHGARNPDWARPIEAIAAAMRARSPQTPVSPAYLEFLSPTLPQAIAELASAGCQEIAIVPMFMANSGHTQRDLPGLLELARQERPWLVLTLAAPIGEAETVVEAIAAYALSA